MNEDFHSREFPATTEGLAAAQAFLEEYCTAPKPCIIVDELVSNVVRCSGANRFTLSFEVKSPSLDHLVLADDGVPFDATQAPEPDISSDAASREVGGLGIFMVRKLSKSLAYERRDGQNVLTVTF